MKDGVAYQIHQMKRTYINFVVPRRGSEVLDSEDSIQNEEEVVLTCISSNDHQEVVDGGQVRGER